MTLASVSPWVRKALTALTVAVLCLAVATPSDARRKKRRKKARVGKLEISTMTDGATVLVDGKEVGTLPLPAPINLPVGKHTLKVFKRGYTEFLDVFTIRSRKTTTLDVDLLPVAGILIITCATPDAQVYIDGKYMGIAPQEQEVLIGERSIKVRKPGFYDYMKSVKAIAGKVVRIKIKLKAMPVGSLYRPAPPPPPKWYEKWYVWVGAAGGVAAITAAIVIPVVVASSDPISDFGAEFSFKQP